MKTIGLFFGGLSNEAEVSIVSAQNVVKNFDYKKYKLVLIYWDKKDSYFYHVLSFNQLRTKRKKVSLDKLAKLIDVALLMTHGRYGEDGILQALLESQKIKYSGCRVLSSAICMDKAVFKDMLNSSSIKQVRYQVLDYVQYTSKEIMNRKKEIKESFSLPMYIKPANSGSSIGITKIEKITDLDRAIRLARKHDSKVVVEEGLVGAREIEIAVLGNDRLIVSDPGELKLAKDFYNYDDKYKLGQTRIVIPAPLSKKKTEEIRNLAKEVYRLFNCQGFARVDFLLSDNKVYLNEINTLPGFTDISMYPMLMMKTGMSYKTLINKIINLAY